MGRRPLPTTYGGNVRGGSGAARPAPADEVSERSRSAGGVANASCGSETLDGRGQSIVTSAVDNFAGASDIAVNNAGILPDRMISQHDRGVVDAVNNTHLKGATRGQLRRAPIMPSRRRIGPST